VINMEAFHQILDLDDDETPHFSSSIILAYFTQARSMIKMMDNALRAKHLQEISFLSHFLKGSSGQIGVSHIEVSCQKIQYCSKIHDEHNDSNALDTKVLDIITALLGEIKSDYEVAEIWLKNWYYMEKGKAGPPPDSDD
ncbi:signal transduction histidine kinase, partial [Armillaria mellea]